MIDGTAGSGGHAREILNRLGRNGKLLLVDWDKENVASLNKNFLLPNVKAVQGNYTKLPEIMREKNFPKANGLLLDLGFSSEQLKGRDKGFSFQKAEPLIMTYGEEREPLSEFLKRASVKELTEIISKFGEERYANQIAKAIFGQKDKIRTSQDLGEIIKKAVPEFYERGRIHPATRTFQALRIYLNQELENLKKVLSVLDEILLVGGRIAIISFHSLEDRIVKNCFKELEKEGRLKILTKKPIIASSEEIAINPRVRSAKLRGGILIK